MLRLSVGGDAEGGWLVDIHDGEKAGAYRPEGDSDVAALVAAIKEHDSALFETLKARLGGDEDKREIVSLTAQLTETHNFLDKAIQERDEAVAKLTAKPDDKAPLAETADTAA